MKNLDEDLRDFRTAQKIEIGVLIAALGFVIGFIAHMYLNPQHEVVKTVYAEAKPLTYDQQHLLAIDFMADNPHVRYQICSKSFKHVMDSDGGGK